MLRQLEAAVGPLAVQQLVDSVEREHALRVEAEDLDRAAGESHA